jgi:transcriptional regulator
MSVYISGEMRIMSGEELIAFMQKITLKFEGGNTASKTIYDNLPDTFLNKMMPAIVGFEIKATHIDNVFKLSQNRDQASYQNIITQLINRGVESALIAQEMIKRESALFPEGVEWDVSRFDS